MCEAPDWYYECNACGWDSIAEPDFMGDECPECGETQLLRIELSDLTS